MTTKTSLPPVDPERLAPVDFARRDVLRKSMALGVGVLLPGMLVPGVAQAYVDKLPPGFQPHLLDDEGLRQIMARMMGLIPGSTNDIAKYTLRRVLIRRGWTEGFESVNNKTPVTQPAYWFAIDYYNYVYNQDLRQNTILDRDMPITMDRLKSENLPLYHFASGNQYYFMTWVIARPRGNAKSVEEHLLKSIFTAAGKSEAEVDAYLQLDMAGKERVLRDVMGRFHQIGARMKRAGEEARRRKTETERRNADELATLDREVFILERRLEREELSYEREYELTRELATKKQRLQTLRNASVTLDTSAEKAQYNRLLVAAWASTWLVNNYWNQIKSKDDLFDKNMLAMNNHLEIPLRKYVPKIRGAPFYYGKRI